MASRGSIARLRRRMAAIPKSVREATVPALLKSAEENAATMRRLVPVDEGDLRDSIEVTRPGHRTPAYSQPGGSMVVPGNAVAVTVGNHAVRYGHLVEFGSVSAPAQPFFWPSVRLNRKRSTNRIKRAVGKAVRIHWGGP